MTEPTTPGVDDPQAALAAARAAALRQMADLIEEHPALAGSLWAGATLGVSCLTLDELRDRVADLGQPLVVRACDDHKLVTVRRDFGAGVILSLALPIDVVDALPPLLPHEVGIANSRAALAGVR